jgi:hypothetical protein
MMQSRLFLIGPHPSHVIPLLTDDSDLAAKEIALTAGFSNYARDISETECTSRSSYDLCACKTYGTVMVQICQPAKCTEDDMP